MDDDDRLNKLLGKKDNEELNRVLGRKSKTETKNKKTIKCPKCGHEFVEE